MNPRIAVISGRYPETTFASPVNHRIYCDRHGYHYIHCNWPNPVANPYLNKIHYIAAHLDLFDIVFWIDDDAFFLDIDRSLDHILPGPDSFLSICASPDFKAIHTYVSSGQFALRCDARGRRFIDAVLATDLDDVRRWWQPELGYFSNGDQDAIVYLLHTDQDFADHVERHPYTSFNSRLQNLTDEGTDPPFLVHFTGTRDVKKRDITTAQRLLNRGPTLLPHAALDRWPLALHHRSRKGLLRRFLHRLSRCGRNG